MKRVSNKLTIVVICVVVLSILVGGIAFKIIPPSLQIYFAGVAGCNVSDEILGKDDPKFEGVKFWEPPLAHIYRWKQLVSEENFVVNDSLTKNDSVYHIFLTASDSTENVCDNEILEMVNYYHRLGAPIDHYNDRGFTPLHESILMQNISMARSFLKLNANRNMVVKKEGSPVDNMNVIELAVYVQGKNPEEEIPAMMVKLLKNEI